jgi:hypothetical protein
VASAVGSSARFDRSEKNVIKFDQQTTNKPRKKPFHRDQIEDSHLNDQVKCEAKVDLLKIEAVFS